MRNREPQHTFTTTSMHTHAHLLLHFYYTHLHNCFVHIHPLPSITLSALSIHATFTLQMHHTPTTHLSFIIHLLHIHYMSPKLSHTHTTTTTITHLLHFPPSHYIYLPLIPSTLFIHHPHTSYTSYTYYTSHTFIIHNTPITHSSVITHALHPLLIYYTHNQQMHIYYTSTPHLQSLGTSSYTVILHLVTFTTHFTHT
ncbi:unnamed protein product [Boreogadus saida]